MITRRTDFFVSQVRYVEPLLFAVAVLWFYIYRVNDRTKMDGTLAPGTGSNVVRLVPKAYWDMLLGVGRHTMDISLQWYHRVLAAPNPWNANRGGFALHPGDPSRVRQFSQKACFDKHAAASAISARDNMHRNGMQRTAGVSMGLSCFYYGIPAGEKVLATCSPTLRALLAQVYLDHQSSQGSFGFDPASIGKKRLAELRKALAVPNI